MRMSSAAAATAPRALPRRTHFWMMLFSCEGDRQVTRRCPTTDWGPPPAPLGTDVATVTVDPILPPGQPYLGLGFTSIRADHATAAGVSGAEPCARNRQRNWVAGPLPAASVVVASTAAAAAATAQMVAAAVAESVVAAVAVAADVLDAATGSDATGAGSAACDAVGWLCSCSRRCGRREPDPGTEADASSSVKRTRSGRAAAALIMVANAPDTAGGCEPREAAAAVAAAAGAEARVGAEAVAERLPAAAGLEASSGRGRFAGRRAAMENGFILRRDCRCVEPRVCGKLVLVQLLNGMSWCASKRPTRAWNGARVGASSSAKAVEGRQTN